MGNDDLISVYAAENVTEAHFVKNLLLDAGIKASVTEENEPLPASITPPHVMVFKADEDRARVILADYEELELKRAERPDWTCPKCGVTVIGAFDECDACGADRPGSEEEDE